MIEKILIIALVTLGYCCTFWPGMIFSRIGDWMDEHAPEWLWKPLGGCYICACMWVGSVVYWWLHDWQIIDLSLWRDWFLSCVGAMGVNAFISELTNKPEEIETKEDKPVKVEIVKEKEQPLMRMVKCKYCPQESMIANWSKSFICLGCGRVNEDIN